MRISLIAAASRNGVIGRDGKLPWHLPNDFRYFKRMTTGQPIVMGRRTWESLGGPLPERSNIVMTRQAGFLADGARVVATADEALAAAGDAEELMVIGGGEIYAQFLDSAARVYLTLVDADVDGDTRFPALDEARWRLTSRESHRADERHAHAYEFRIYERR